MANAASEIRDDLIAQDVRYRRVEAGINRKVNARFNQLERDLKALLVRIDPNGAQRVAARRRRMKKFDRESGELIAKAYSDINRMVKEDLRRVGAVESKNVLAIMRRHIP